MNDLESLTRGYALFEIITNEFDVLERIAGKLKLDLKKIRDRIGENRDPNKFTYEIIARQREEVINSLEGEIGGYELRGKRNRKQRESSHIITHEPEYDVFAC